MNELITLLLSKNVVFEAPWKLSDGSLSAVVPIRLKTPVGKRKYLMYEEVKDRIKITDSGTINQLNIANFGDDPVFLRGGTAFEGIGTQSRVAKYGKIIMPERGKQIIEVNCIHASHGIATGSVFVSAGVVPNQVERVLHKSFNRSVQSEVWDTAQRYAQNMRARYADVRASTASLQTPRVDNLIGIQRSVEATEQFRKEVDEKLSKIPDYTDQIGVVIVNVRGIVGLEVFDDPRSYMALAKSIVKKYVEELSETSDENLYTLDTGAMMQAIISFLHKLLQRNEAILYEDASSKTVAITGDSFNGEYTQLAGKTIHLVVSKKEKREQIVHHEARPLILRGMRFQERNDRAPEPTVKQVAPQVVMHAIEVAREPGHSFLTKKDGWNLLNILGETPQTWTELHSRLGLSDRSLAKRLNEAENLHLVEKVPRLSNGKGVYRLTARGHVFKDQAKAEYRT